MTDNYDILSIEPLLVLDDDPSTCIHSREEDGDYIVQETLTDVPQPSPQPAETPKSVTFKPVEQVDKCPVIDEQIWFCEEEVAEDALKVAAKRAEPQPSDARRPNDSLKCLPKVDTQDDLRAYIEALGKKIDNLKQPTIVTHNHYYAKAE